MNTEPSDNTVQHEENMKVAVFEYYKTGSLPENVNKDTLCDYLLKGIFPKKSIRLFNGGKVTLKNASPFPIGDYGSDYSVVEAARTSHGQGLKGETPDQGLMNFLWKHNHRTPYEHITFTVRIVCPQALSKHFMRHRTFSFNEISARYKPVDGSFYLPDKLRSQSKSNRQCSTDNEVPNQQVLLKKIELHYLSSKELYDELLDAGVTREQARFVLPQATYTTFYMTGNLRNWLHFLGLREASDAQYEMQIFASAIHDLIRPYIPMTEKAMTA